MPKANVLVTFHGGKNVQITDRNLPNFKRLNGHKIESIKYLDEHEPDLRNPLVEGESNHTDINEEKSKKDGDKEVASESPKENEKTEDVVDDEFISSLKTDNPPSVRELKSHIKKANDVDYLEEVLEAEMSNSGRTSAIKEINNKIKQLS